MDCFEPYEPIDLVQPLAEFQFDQPSEGFLGLREWRLRTRMGRVELGSISRESSWSPASSFPAECHKGHRAGRAQCTCGFHMTLPTLSAAQDLEQAMYSGSTLTIVGVGRCWGQVTVDPKIIRSEQAEVEAVFVGAQVDDIYGLWRPG